MPAARCGAAAAALYTLLCLWYIWVPQCAVSSVGECYLDRVEVAGSNPAPRTIIENELAADRPSAAMWLCRSVRPGYASAASFLTASSASAAGTTSSSSSFLRRTSTVPSLAVRLPMTMRIG